MPRRRRQPGSQTDADPQAPPGHAGGWRDAIGVAVVAAAMRWLHVVDSMDAPGFLVPIVDSEVYVGAARQLANGGGLSEAFVYQPAFYPLTLAVIFRFLGSSLLIAVVVQTIAGAVTCGLTTVLAGRLVRRAVALGAGLTMAVYGPLILFDGELLATTWAGLWMVCLLLLTDIARGRKTHWAVVAVGAVAALAIVTRPTFAPLVAALLIGLVLEARRRGHAPLLRGLIAASSMAVVLFPFGTISERITGRFSILPASGGLNLYIGNNPDRCRTVATRPGYEWIQLVSSPRRDGHVGIWEEDAWFRARTREAVLADPVSTARGLVVKTLEFFSSRELPRNLDPYLQRRWSSILGATMWRLGPWGFPFGLVLPVAVLGVAACWRRVPWMIHAAAWLYPAAVIAVFTSARYRAPFVVVAVLVAAIGVDRVCQAVMARDPMGLRGPIAIATAVALLITVTGPFCQEGSLESEYFYLLGVAKMQAAEGDDALAFLNRSIELRPEAFEPHLMAGRVLAVEGRLDDAAGALSTATRLEPSSVEAWRQLAAVQLLRGDLDEAVEALERVIQLDPDDAVTSADLGLVLARLGRLEEAAERLVDALRVDPGLEVARRRLEEIHRMQTDALSSAD